MKKKSVKFLKNWLHCLPSFLISSPHELLLAKHLQATIYVHIHSSIIVLVASEAKVGLTLLDDLTKMKMKRV
jgi:hypothetical protein